MAQYALVQSRWLGDSINLSGPRLNGLQDSTPTELFNHTNMADQPPADTPATEPAAEEAPAEPAPMDTQEDAPPAEPAAEPAPAEEPAAAAEESAPAEAPAAEEAASMEETPAAPADEAPAAPAEETPAAPAEETAPAEAAPVQEAPAAATEAPAEPTPMETDAAPKEQADVWEERWSNTNNKIYYLNVSKTASQWDKPEGVDVKKLDILPVRASHLLVKHEQSRRPSSWRQETITRTKEEARAILQAHRDALTAADDLVSAFAKLASQESDCSSAKVAGDLGYFGGPSRTKMQEEFDAASYALQVGQLSEIIETASGLHLILRTA
ncbi:MAG: hypothetical protein SGCHY_004478 [Lobulomycetales sp.]